MAEESNLPPEPQASPPDQPRDAGNWATQGARLSVSAMPPEAININVEGRRAMGPLQGFGPLWQKVYRIRLSGTQVTPVEVIATWKAHFAEFWPRGSRFFAPLTGIAPGEVALLRLQLAGGVRLSTGVLVLYADEESFTLMTPEGHVFAGWITFSAYNDGEATIAQTQVQMRANDPIYELGLRFGGQLQEDRFWQHTLTAVAAHFGCVAPVEMEVTCLDRHIQWSYIGNIRHNAAVRTTIYTVTTPARWVGRLFVRKR